MMLFLKRENNKQNNSILFILEYFYKKGQFEVKEEN